MGHETLLPGHKLAILYSENKCMRAITERTFISGERIPRTIMEQKRRVRSLSLSLSLSLSFSLFISLSERHFSCQVYTHAHSALPSPWQPGEREQRSLFSFYLSFLFHSFRVWLISLLNMRASGIEIAHSSNKRARTGILCSLALPPSLRRLLRKCSLLLSPFSPLVLPLAFFGFCGRLFSLPGLTPRENGSSWLSNIVSPPIYQVAFSTRR